MKQETGVRSTVNRILVNVIGKRFAQEQFDDQREPHLDLIEQGDSYLARRPG